MNDFQGAFVTKGLGEYQIIKEDFESQGNTGWYYKTLKDGFTSEEEAQEFLSEKLVHDTTDLLLHTILELQRLQVLVSNVDDEDKTIGVALSELGHKFHGIYDRWESGK